MKRTIVAVLGALALLGSTPARAVTIGFTGTADPTKVDVVVSDLGSQIVAGYDLDVTYDDVALDVADVVFGTQLGGPLDSFQVWDALTVPGILNLYEVSFLYDPAALDPEGALAALQLGGTVNLATITFSSGVDVADLGFSWTAGKDVKGRGNQVIIPNPIPEPGSALLLGTGLLGAALARRKKK